MALARLATGDQEAEEELRAALATADPEIASRAAERLAEVFLEEGEAGEAAEVLLEALSVPEVAEVPRLRVMLGIAHLELPAPSSPRRWRRAVTYGPARWPSSCWRVRSRSGVATRTPSGCGATAWRAPTRTSPPRSVSALDRDA